VQTIFKEILFAYNESHMPLRMVLFDFAVDHLTRIHRVLRMPQGHCLVIGVGGSGKASLIRLASYTADCEVFEITLSRGYSESSFRDDLKVSFCCWSEFSLLLIVSSNIQDKTLELTQVEVSALDQVVVIA
jgi:dynein heavy chain